MFSYIEKSELLKYGGRHFVSEKFLRMCTVEYKKENQPMKWIHEDWNKTFELLIIILKGSGKLETPNMNVSFGVGDQIYLINTTHRLLSYENIELELIYLPGPYEAVRFSPTKNNAIYFNKMNLTSVTNAVIVDEIYGKIHILKLDSVYNGILEGDESLFLICLEGSADFEIGDDSVNLRQGDQIYINNGAYKIYNCQNALFEFIYAPAQKYYDAINIV